MAIFCRLVMLILCLLCLHLCNADSCSSRDLEATLFKMIMSGLRNLQNDKDTSLFEGTRQSGGANYIHWGRSSCTSDNAVLVYDGYVGGASYNQRGSAVNQLCLPKTPQWGVYDNKVNNHPFVGGSSFDNADIDIKNSIFEKGGKNHMHGIPCSVCETKKGVSALMIPGRKTCFGNWKTEYTGYLMSGRPTHQAATEYLCMDANAEPLVKINDWTDKNILYSVHAKCNGLLPCPPYVEGREMTCVVCSKQ